jgi:hypothetical protein
MDLPALPYSAHGRPFVAVKASQAFAANIAKLPELLQKP